MTDCPRFHMARGRPDDCHRQRHGAALVECAFRLAEWWLKHRDAATTVCLGSRNLSRGRIMMRGNVEITRTARICQVASLLVILSVVFGVLTHDVMRGPERATEREATRVVVVP